MKNKILKTDFKNYLNNLIYSFIMGFMLCFCSFIIYNNELFLVWNKTLSFILGVGLILLCEIVLFYNIKKLYKNGC